MLLVWSSKSCSTEKGRQDLAGWGLQEMLQPSQPGGREAPRVPPARGQRGSPMSPQPGGREAPQCPPSQGAARLSCAGPSPLDPTKEAGSPPLLRSRL